MSEERLNEELAAIEAALGSLAPVPSAVHRDQLLFLAGRALESKTQASRRRSIHAWVWPSATAASLLAAALFGLLWATASQTEVAPRIVYVPVPKQEQVATGLPSSDFAGWKLRPVALRKSGQSVRQPNAAPPGGDPVRSKEGGASPSA